MREGWRRWVGGGGSWRGSQQLLTSCLSLEANFGAERGLEGERKRFRTLVGLGAGGGRRPACLQNSDGCWRRKQEVAPDRETRRVRECLGISHHYSHGNAFS